MKVLIIHNKYGKFSGEEAVVEAQIEILKSHGVDVYFYYRSSKEVDEMIFGKAVSFFSGFVNIPSIRRIKEIISNQKFDLVHIHNLFPLISPTILPVIKKAGLPIIMSVHNYRLLCPNGLFYTDGKVCERCTKGLMEMNCLIQNCEDSLFKSLGYGLRNSFARIMDLFKANVDLYLCLSEFQKEKLISNSFDADKCIVIPNMMIKRSESQRSVKNGYGIFVGRLNSQKGFDLLVYAATLLPDVKIKVAGEGDNTFLSELNIPTNVELQGKLNEEEMNRIYMGGSFLIFCSKSYEGFPMVFLEAMAHKLAVIAPDFAGYPEIVENEKTGLLFEPGNVNSLADSISKLWNQPEYAVELGINGFYKGNQKYSKDNYFNNILNAYQRVIEKNYNR
jgi:glycosyltransferase involved in cell wall biosynthesis